MCFGGSPKPPSIPAAPAPVPPPTITPSTITTESNEQVRRKQVERMRLGLYSTIKTKPTIDLNGMGTTGQPGKTTLG